MTMHTLRISREHGAVKKLRKDARTFAMTGGFELELAAELSTAELEALVGSLLPELSTYPNDMRRQSNLVYRVLELIRTDARCSDALRNELHHALSESSGRR